MSTRTHPPTRKRSGGRWALVVIVTLCVLAAVIVEVVWPLSAGLPIGWSQYDSASAHLHVAAPPLWYVFKGNETPQQEASDCNHLAITIPLLEPAPQTLDDLATTTQWMAVFVAGSCDRGPGDPTASLQWQPTGQYAMVAGQNTSIEMSSAPSAQQVMYRVRVTTHGFDYTLVMREPSEAQAQQDMPSFLTFAHSFRYMN